MAQGPDQSVWGEFELFDASIGAAQPNGPKFLRYPRDPNIDNLQRPAASLAAVPEGTGTIWKSNGNGTWTQISGGSGTGDITNAANVGVGTGLSFRDKVGTILNYRTLLGGDFIEITTVGDEILFEVTGSAGLWDAIVCPPDSGLVGPNIFNTLGAAVDAGARSIWICRGLYIETGIIDLLDNTRIEGEGKDGSRIDFNNSGHIRATGAGRLITAGTIGVTNGSVDVTGVGTNFTTLQNADVLMIDGIAYSISATLNNFAITLRNAYNGPTRLGVTDWFGMSKLAGIQLSSFTIRDTDVEAVELIQIINTRIRDVIMIDGGVTTDRCIDAVIENMVSTGTSGVLPGVELGNFSSDIHVRGLVLRSPNGAGVRITGGSQEITLMGCAVYHAALDAFFTDGSVAGVTMDGCVSTFSSGNGFVLDGNGLAANNCRADDNGIAGFVLDGGARVTGSCAARNTTHGIQVRTGSGAVVTGNTSVTNTGAGVRFEAGVVDPVVVGNFLGGNVTPVSDGGAVTPLFVGLNRP